MAGKRAIGPSARANVLCTVVLGQGGHRLAVERAEEEARKSGHRITDGPHQIASVAAGEVEATYYASATVPTWRHWWLRLTGGR